MWLGLALVLWLWGLALYLGVYYFAVWKWGALGLYDVLGQDFYNAHVPGGGWEATVVPTIVFLATLGIVRAARRPIESASAWTSHYVRVPRKASLIACNLALIALLVPSVHAAVVGSRDAINAAIRRAELAESQRVAAERRAHDPFFTGEGMRNPVAFLAGGAFWGERLILGSDGTFRRSSSGCMGGDHLEGRFSRDGHELRFDPPPPGFEPYSEPLSRLCEVPWGRRLYLVALDRDSLRDFCNAVNAGSDGRAVGAGRVLLREGDESVPVSGLPTLPQGYGENLLQAPLEGHTLGVAADGSTWVDLGSARGLRVDMILFVPNAPAGGEWHDIFGGGSRTQPLEILEVQPDRCRVRYRYAPERKPPLAAGLLVTSRPVAFD